MEFLVVGHLCLDVIHTADGKEVESYGGIYYTVATLAALSGPKDSVIPVFGVNKADYAALTEDLSRYPNVDTSGIYKVEEPTNRVHLFYKDNGSRMECSKDIAQPIPFEKLKRRLAVDAVLVNMVSGFDITLETLDHLRMAVRGDNTPILFDYHSLTLGIDAKHERFRRPLADWRRWAFMVDIIQMNEEEILGLPVEKMTEEQIASHLLTLSVKGVVVTRGARGATLYYNDRKKMMRKDIEGIRIEQVMDPTGCGDIFGAAFLRRYVETPDLQTAAVFANRVAAAKVSIAGSHELHRLKDAIGTAS
jgi:sugar/nucleoside kinase (ribokinase family)